MLTDIDFTLTIDSSHKRNTTMIKVYTKLDNKLAQWDVETDDYAVAIEVVKEALPKEHGTAVLVRIK